MDYCLCVPEPELQLSNASLEFHNLLDTLNTTLNVVVDLSEPAWHRTVRLIKFTSSVGAITLNSLSLLAIMVSRCTMTANIRFLSSLAISDLLCGICGFLNDPTVASIFSCSRRVSKCLVVASHLTALMTILGLAVDHYLAICRPLYHRSDDNIRRVTVAIVAIWIMSGVASMIDVVAEVINYVERLHTQCSATLACSSSKTNFDNFR